MFPNKQTTTKAEITTSTASTPNKVIKVYDFKDAYKIMPSHWYGPDVQKSLEDKKCTLVADNGSVKTYTGLAGYEYAVLVQHAEVDYLICFDTWRAHVLWMRQFSMLAHVIDKLLPNPIAKVEVRLDDEEGHRY